MKKAIFKTILSTIIVAIIVVGCTKEDNGAGGPIIDFVSDSGYLYIDTAIACGDTAMVRLSCTWNGSNLIKKINTYINGTMEETYLIEENMGQSLVFEYKITKSINPKEFWEFEVIDDGGNSSRLNLTIINDLSGGSVNTFYPIIGAQNNSAYGSYFNLTKNLTFKNDLADTSQKFVDIASGFTYDQKSFITSPGSDSLFGVYDFNTWQVKNLTQFCATTISKYQFNLTTKDNLLISSFHPDKALNNIKELKTDDVYSFKTQNGKYGLLLIINAALNEEGYISFDVKVQP